MQYLVSSDIGRPWYFVAHSLITESHDYEWELILQEKVTMDDYIKSGTYFTKDSLPYIFFSVDA